MASQAPLAGASRPALYHAALGGSCEVDLAMPERCRAEGFLVSDWRDSRKACDGRRGAAHGRSARALRDGSPRREDRPSPTGPKPSRFGSPVIARGRRASRYRVQSSAIRGWTGSVWRTRESAGPSRVAPEQIGPAESGAWAGEGPETAPGGVRLATGTPVRPDESVQGIQNRSHDG